MSSLCVLQTKHLGRLPVVNFAAGGVATPADAALMMQMGMDGVFVGSGIFKSGDPAKRARAIVQASSVPPLVSNRPGTCPRYMCCTFMLGAGRLLSLQSYLHPSVLLWSACVDVAIHI
jgi:tRNA-dihydrouridine synthase